MSLDEKVRPKGPHEYAAATEREKAVRKERPRRTRFIFKFFGLILVVFAAGWAWYSYKKGAPIDLTDPQQAQQTLDQARQDAERAAVKTKEASVQAIAYAQRSLSDLEKLIKGKPPETREEVKQLVDESKQAVEKAPPKPAAPVGAPSPAAPPPSPIADAQEEYRVGQEFYIKTDPMASQHQVQSNLHLAEPHFAKCLDLLEAARGRNVNGPEIDHLEQAAARRLYDCRKRMELQRN